eukprot:gene6700-4798_t
MLSGASSTNPCPYCAAEQPDELMLAHILQCPARAVGLTAARSASSAACASPRIAALQEHMAAALEPPTTSSPPPLPARPAMEAGPTGDLSDSPPPPPSEGTAAPTAQIHLLEQRVLALERTLAATQMAFREQQQQSADMWLAMERLRTECEDRLRAVEQRPAVAVAPAPAPPAQAFSLPYAGAAPMLQYRGPAVQALPYSQHCPQPQISYPSLSSGAAPPRSPSSAGRTSPVPSPRYPPMAGTPVSTPRLQQPTGSTTSSPSKLPMSAIVQLLQQKSPAVVVRMPPAWGLSAKLLSLPPLLDTPRKADVGPYGSFVVPLHVAALSALIFSSLPSLRRSTAGSTVFF